MTADRDIIGSAQKFVASGIDLGDHGEMKAIAEAFLIAVEELERIAKGIEYHPINDMTLRYSMTTDVAGNIARKALSRIRSL